MHFVSLSKVQQENSPLLSQLLIDEAHQQGSGTWTRSLVTSVIRGSEGLRPGRDSGSKEAERNGPDSIQRGTAPRMADPWKLRLHLGPRVHHQQFMTHQSTSGFPLLEDLDPFLIHLDLLTFTDPQL